MRVAGTARNVASAFDVMPDGSRKSSRRISPGWTGGRLLTGRRLMTYSSGSVVIDDFDFVRSVFAPDETQAELVVDTDAVATGKIAFQRFQSIAGRRTQELQRLRGIELLQLAHGDAFERLESSGRPGREQRFGVLARERDDGHTLSVLRLA